MGGSARAGGGPAAARVQADLKAAAGPAKGGPASGAGRRKRAREDAASGGTRATRSGRAPAQADTLAPARVAGRRSQASGAGAEAPPPAKRRLLGAGAVAAALGAEPTRRLAAAAANGDAATPPPPQAAKAKAKAGRRASKAAPARAAAQPRGATPHGGSPDPDEGGGGAGAPLATPPAAPADQAPARRTGARSGGASARPAAARRPFFALSGLHTDESARLGDALQALGYGHTDGRRSHLCGANRPVAAPLMVSHSAWVASTHFCSTRTSGGACGGRVFLAHKRPTPSARKRAAPARAHTRLRARRRWDARVTHVVTPELRRAVKTLAAFAAGAWVLRTSFLEASAHAHMLVEPVRGLACRRCAVLCDVLRDMPVTPWTASSAARAGHSLHAGRSSASACSPACRIGQACAWPPGCACERQAATRPWQGKHHTGHAVCVTLRSAVRGRGPRGARQTSLPRGRWPDGPRQGASGTSLGQSAGGGTGAGRRRSTSWSAAPRGSLRMARRGTGGCARSPAAAAPSRA